MAGKSSLSWGSAEAAAVQLCAGLEKVADVIDSTTAPIHSFLQAQWDLMVANYSEFTICSLFSFVFHETCYFGFALPWMLFDQIPFMRKFRIQPNKVRSWAEYSKCLKQLLFSHICIQLPMMLAFHFVIKTLGFQIDGQLPQFSELAWQIPVFLVIEDFYFYWVHRFLHWKKIYKYIHKVHHEHAAPFGIAAEYAHPAETLLLGLGTLLGPMFFCRHLFTLWAYLGVRLWETIEDHSGYDFPLNPTNLFPFWGGAVHHDYHHKTFVGPYSSIFTWCDWIFGTDKLFRKHQVKLRGGKDCDYYPAAFRGAPNMEALQAATKKEE